MGVEEVKAYMMCLQDDICKQLEDEDGSSKFQEDVWQHKSGGGGRTRVIKNGALIEKGGVNFSHVTDFNLPDAILNQKPELNGYTFQAMGVSLVIHSHNPFVPTSHANVRLFYAEKEDKEPIWWFGGGYDLTPYYPFEEDCIFWHQIAKKSCQDFDDDTYDKYKKWCDEYFFLPHRNETRGIGGLFFDYIKHWDFDKCFSFIKSVGDSYIKAYRPILEKRKSIDFTQKHKDFQLLHRGRYAEYNLIYDRGTHFGLQSGGRTESILMSLPPVVRWDYDFKPEIGSEEEKLYLHYLKPRSWV
jgi:coproporphyrinogen III oxidase